MAEERVRTIVWVKEPVWMESVNVNPHGLVKTAGNCRVILRVQKWGFVSKASVGASRVTVGTNAKFLAV